MDDIDELREALESLGPGWNITGKVDRMKKMLDNIERDTITLKLNQIK
jgi:hypothetical protein